MIFLILSFSENGNSRLLWDSYSKKSGYNIELSSNFIRDFISNTPLIETRLNDTTKTWEKAIKGYKVKILPKANETLNFGYSAYANRVLYDKEKQIAIFKELLSSITEALETKQHTDIQLCLSTILEFIPFFKDETLRDEEEYRLIINISSPTRQSAHGKKQYLRSIQRYRDVDNRLFPYIVLKMYDKTYIKSVSMGYSNDELAFETLKDFISTLPYDIKVNKAAYSLRW